MLDQEPPKVGEKSATPHTIGRDLEPAPEQRIEQTTTFVEETLNLNETPLPTTAPLSAKEVFKAVNADVAAAGISKGRLGLEVVRSSASEVLRWGSTLSLLGFGLNAANEYSATALAFIAAAAVMSSLASWMDRSSRNMLNELERKFTRRLYTRLIEINGRSNLEDLDDEDKKAQLDMHWERASTVANVVENSVELPSVATKIVLSVGALMAADWRLGIILAAAVIPSFLVKNRQAKEDLELEDKQRRQSKIVDTLNDEAFSTNGTLRLAFSRMTNRFSRLVESIQTTLDSEKDAHERRQARVLTIADAVYFGSLLTGNLMLFLEYQSGAFGIGALAFLWTQLMDIGSELDDHSDKAQEYFDLAHKTKAFYGFIDYRTRPADVDFPTDHSIKLEDVKFSRGKQPDPFIVTLPDLELHPGDLVIVHGPSGAGKTTLLQRLAGAANPTTGQYLVGNIPSNHINSDSWGENISYCPAVPALLEGLTIEQALSLDPHGEDYIDQRVNHPLLKDIIESVSTGHGLQTRIGPVENGRTFSTGELKRFMLVTALVGPHKIVILDEGTANLNETLVDLTGEEINKARVERGAIVIFATHSKRLDDHASHIINVSKGQAELIENSKVENVDEKSEQRRTA